MNSVWRQVPPHSVNLERAKTPAKKQKQNKQTIKKRRVRQLVPVNFTLLNFFCMFSLIRITCCLAHSLFSFCSSHGGNSSLSQDGSKIQEAKTLLEIKGWKCPTTKPCKHGTNEVYFGTIVLITCGDSRAGQAPLRVEHHEVLPGPTKS